MPIPHKNRLLSFHRRATGLLLALYLTLLFGAVIPAHHHDDDTDHGHCVFCIIANEPFVTATVIILVLSVFISVSAFRPLYVPVPFLFIRAFDSRAPPQI